MRKVDDYPDMLSNIVKATRQRDAITVEQLAKKLGVTKRYLYRIENENGKPSYNTLFKLIRELNLSPDMIFYPEKSSTTSEIESLAHMLHSCDERSLQIIKATVKAAIESQQ